MIESNKNTRLKRLRRLSREAKVRSQERAFVAEGLVLVREALAAPGVDVQEIYVDETVDAEVRRELGRHDGYELVRSGLLSNVLDTVSPQPVAAVVSMPPASIDDLALDRPVLVLAELRDPGNVGTLIRTAEAAGFAGVVLAGASVDPTNPKVVRAAAGARFRLPVVLASDTVALFTVLRSQGRLVLATVVDDGSEYTLLDLSSAAMVLGNEAHGLSAELAAAADEQVTITLAGPTESLNVAAAGAVLCFESLRQRRNARPHPQIS